ncbi:MULTISPECIES: CoA ester lyase [unclassified Acinetobacter]|uniref:HpcH/HpaI aldolase/citrate lyase family protein n=1 Tax=unclassified Acinetobacter TaxID=196816 RepID=UPI002934FF4A|nr:MULTISPECIES: CoA ester lyase [unclassified Acinetobacter]WOE32947.1 CoA ester lyase [Acinetobacter sp. SAAs470]WOE38424.1 CoA ester lyase [Acinetobacter sp. SAAs474]
MEKVQKSARSYLFVPANRIERFEKALNTKADAIIIDLEDAVPVDLKISARDELKTWLTDHPLENVMIRINSKSSEWFVDDIQLTKFSNIRAIILPKTESVADIDAVTALRAIDVFALIETPLGFANIRQIAQAKSVKALMFGSIDFQLEMNMQGGYEELLSFRNEFVLASKLAGIESPVDGVTVDFKNKALVERETLQAKQLGFAGKLCIHPNQVDIVNTAFTPTDAELTWAQRVLNAVNQTQGQAISLDGKMIDLPVILRAQKILKQANLNT